MTATLLLYHGTSAQFLPAIQRAGLAPRAQTKARGNWSHTVASNPKAVYLTDAYAWHFAVNASNEKEKGLILELDDADLLPWLLCPDEDFMEQASRRVPPTPEQPNTAPIEWSMERRTRFYRKIAKFNPRLAGPSLKHMGTAAYYGTIPWDAVRRYVIIDWNKLHPQMRLKAVDSMVSCLNYQFLQDRHRAFTRWFFGDPVTPAELIGFGKLETGDASFKRLIQQQEEHTAEAMANRDGLTVVDLCQSTMKGEALCTPVSM